MLCERAARLTAVDIDPELVELPREGFAGCPGVEIVEGDATGLECDAGFDRAPVDVTALTSRISTAFETLKKQRLCLGMHRSSLQSETRFLSSSKRLLRFAANRRGIDKLPSGNCLLEL